MDFLNRAYSQVTDLLRSMTPSTRITSGLLAATIVISLVYLFAFQINGGSEFLLGAHEFSHEDLEEMQKTFAASGLDDAEIVGNRIRVPRSKRVEYLRALSENNFSSEGFDSAMDSVLGEASSFFEPSELRTLKVKHATQKKMALVVSKMDAVADATVQYDEHRTGGYPPKIEKTAIVAVVPAGRRQVDKALGKSIQMTICAAVAGMRPEDVTVTDLVNSRVVAGGSGFEDDERSVYAETKRMAEQDWTQKIRNGLDMYPGVSVSVNVELDPELQNETHKITYDPQPTAVQSNTFTKSTESKPPLGGRPGTVPNEVKGNTPRELYGGNTPESTSEENREQQYSLAGHEQTVTRKAPLVPTKVFASVGLPQSYFAKVWQEQNPTAAGDPPKTPDLDELKNTQLEVTKVIEDIVATLLGVAEPGVDVYPQINVFSFSDLPIQMPTEPSLADTSLVWLGQNWSTLGLIGVGLFSLLFLRGMIRSTTASAPAPVAVEIPLSEADSEEEEKEDIISMLPRREQSTGLTLRQELSALVKDDPDAAANVLRTWIGDAA